MRVRIVELLPQFCEKGNFLRKTHSYPSNISQNLLAADRLAIVMERLREGSPNHNRSLNRRRNLVAMSPLDRRYCHIEKNEDVFDDISILGSLAMTMHGDGSGNVGEM